MSFSAFKERKIQFVPQEPRHGQKYYSNNVPWEMNETCYINSLIFHPKLSLSSSGSSEDWLFTKGQGARGQGAERGWQGRGPVQHPRTVSRAGPRVDPGSTKSLGPPASPWRWGRPKVRPGSQVRIRSGEGQAQPSDCQAGTGTRQV